MARLNTYELDPSIQGGDKWIGTDVESGMAKNFSVDAVAQYFASTGIADPSRLGFAYNGAGIVNEPVTTIAANSFQYRGSALEWADINYIYVASNSRNGASFPGSNDLLKNSLLKVTSVEAATDTAYCFYRVNNVATITGGYELDVTPLNNAMSGNPSTGETTFSVVGSTEVRGVIVSGQGIFSGEAAPDGNVLSNEEDKAGNFYIQYETSGGTTSYYIYGPSTSTGAWGERTPLRGQTGDTGPRGPQGVPGAKGDKGDQGDPGPQGDQGPTGPQGADGADGRDGDPGATGAQGERGPQGIQGNPGIQGPKGDDGDIGEQGAQGIYEVNLFVRAASEPASPTDVTWTESTDALTGTNAAGWTLRVPPSGTNQLYQVRGTFNPAGTETEITSWSNVFQAGSQGPAGMTGPAGGRGPRGLTGATGNSVAIDSVTSGAAAGDTSTVVLHQVDPDGNEVTGSSQTITLQPGSQGERGRTGDTGPRGERGYGITSIASRDTNADGETTEIRITREIDGGTDFDDFTIPTGPQGEDGPTGPTGDSVSRVEQLDDDADGNTVLRFHVTDADGTESALSTNITVNRGATGDRGPEGEQGVQGLTGAAGADGADGAAGDTISIESADIEDGATAGGVTYPDGGQQITITVTDPNLETDNTEVTTVYLSNGADGDKGDPGAAGPNELNSTTTVDPLFTTDNIGEGSSNLYYTDARADARVTEGVEDWAETDNSDTIPNTKLPQSAKLLPVPTSSDDRNKVPVVNSNNSGYELEDVVTQNADNNLQLAGTELTTDNLEPSSTRPYATSSAVRNAVGIDPDGRADIFLNQTGGFSTANVSDDRIDTRIGTVTEDWAVKVENAVGNFVSDNTITIPEAKLPDGTLVDRVQFNLLSSENNTHQVPNQVLTANRTWATGDQATVVGTDGTQRSFVYVGETQSRVTNTGDNHWREIGGGLDIYETGDSDSPVFDVSAIRFASEGFNISTETYSPDAGNRSGVTKTRLVVSLAGGSSTTGSVDITTFEVSSGFSSTAFGSASQTPVFRIAGTVSQSTYTSLSGTIRTGGASGTVVATIPTTTLTSTSFDIRQALAAATTYEVSRTYTVVINVSDGSGSTITDNVNLTIGPSSPGRPSVTPSAASGLDHTTAGEFSLNEVEQFDTGSITYTFNFPNPGSWQLASVTVEDQDGDTISPNESVTFPQTGAVTLSYTLNVAATDENPSITWSTTYNNPSNTSETLTNPPSGAVNRTSVRSFRIGEATSEPTITSLMDLDNSNFTIRFGQRNPSGMETFTTNGGQTLYLVQDSAETQYTTILDNGIDITSDFSIYYLDLDGTRRTSPASTSIFRIYESNIPQPTGIDYTGNYTFS